MDPFEVIGRSSKLFEYDLSRNDKILKEIVLGSKFLVIGAAGSIGQAVTLEIFNRNPKVLHVVDISENNLVELVRTLRSSAGYGSGDFQTFALDCGSIEFSAMIEREGPYDYIFNLSALKHVRSEKDAYTLMRLIRTNILNTTNILRLHKGNDMKNYFCVSTDKAANPVNMMGASKRIMEKFLMRESLDNNISMARFANVAFSDGSLLHGFNQRFLKQQPITAPSDIQRYFLTPKEAGELCLMSGLLGCNRDIFFPKLKSELHLEYFSEIAIRYIKSRGFEPYFCASEHEARSGAKDLINDNKWPLFIFKSDTTGEKEIEEFFTATELVDLKRFTDIGIIVNEGLYDDERLTNFEKKINEFLQTGVWNKVDLLELFENVLPEFTHLDTGKYLDNRM